MHKQTVQLRRAVISHQRVHGVYRYLHARGTPHADAARCVLVRVTTEDGSAPSAPAHTSAVPTAPARDRPAESSPSHAGHRPNRSEILQSSRKAPRCRATPPLRPPQVSSAPRLIGTDRPSIPRAARPPSLLPRALLLPCPVLSRCSPHVSWSGRPVSADTAHTEAGR